MVGVLFCNMSRYQQGHRDVGLLGDDIARTPRIIDASCIPIIDEYWLFLLKFTLVFFVYSQNIILLVWCDFHILYWLGKLLNE